MAPVSKITKNPKKEGANKNGNDGKDGKNAIKKRKKPNKKDAKGIPNINYSSYVHKLLKNQHPQISISSSAMETFNKMSQVLFDKLAKKASEVTIMSGKKTMGSNEMHQACKLLLPGQLAPRASREGAKAAAKYSSNN